MVLYREGDEKELGKVATTDYFGEIPPDRLRDEGGILYLKTDGKYRSKIGMNAKRTKGIAGNYDPISKRLTIVTFDVDPSKIYLNQEWNPKKDPLFGDALNAYNDGPGRCSIRTFLELESCSLRLSEPDIMSTNLCFSFVGDEPVLSPILKNYWE
jgi:hypothetical protein